MDVAALVSTIKDDLCTAYNIRWDVSVIETGEGDVNLVVMPAPVVGGCVLGFNLYLFYTQLIMEMAVENAPPVMMSVFRSIERNGKGNLPQIEAFESLFHRLNGHLIYRINGELYLNKSLKDLKNIQWSYFSFRYESEYLNVHTRLDFNYQELRQHILGLAGFLLLFSNYQEDEGIAMYEEGKAYMDTSVRYERNHINRELCLASKGYRCSVCGIDMEKVYGAIGKNFIEVHHSIPVSDYGQERLINPLAELFPVCPNCHAMLHRRRPPYSIVELKQIMRDAGGGRKTK